MLKPGLPWGLGLYPGPEEDMGGFQASRPQMLLAAVLAVGQEQPSVAQRCWAVMGKVGPRWACTGPFALLGPLLSLRSGPGQARPCVSLWNKDWPRGPGGDSRAAERRDRPQTTVEVFCPCPQLGQVGPWRVSPLLHPSHCGPAPEMSHLGGDGI